MSRPPDAPSPATVRRRLGLYAVGLAIGCLLVGMLLRLRTIMVPQSGPAPPPPGSTAKP